MNRWRVMVGGRVKPLILGMIHAKALPGSPLHQSNMAEIVSTAVEEASVYQKHNIDGLIIENMHDVPYVLSRDVGPETISAMTVVCREVRRVCPDLPIGVQILAGCNREALAVALAADCDFIRAEGYIYSHIADEGLMNACAGPLLRYRSSIKADHISILSDIKKKHSSHSITSDIGIQQVARDSEFFLSDGVIVTGESTGMSANIDQLKAVRGAVSIPVLVGSGVTADNLELYTNADALIVGSHFKEEGKWFNKLDERRISDLMLARDRL